VFALCNLPGGSGTEQLPIFVFKRSGQLMRSVGSNKDVML
jgi:hypothetical protein